LAQSQIRRAGNLKWASDCMWSPNGEQIACSGSNGKVSGLFVTNLNRDVSRLLTDEKITKYQWWPDSRKIVYASKAANQRGSSFWLLDVNTGERILLADPSVVTQVVGNFAVAPDGKKIAFEGEDGNIWVLFLGE
jgi:Tol biopolymer transport system component